MDTHVLYIGERNRGNNIVYVFQIIFFLFFFFYFKSQHLTSIIVEVAYRPRKLPDLPDYSREEKNINSSTRKCTSVINWNSLRWLIIPATEHLYRFPHVHLYMGDAWMQDLGETDCNLCFNPLHTSAIIFTFSSTNSIAINTIYDERFRMTFWLKR